MTRAGREGRKDRQAALGPGLEVNALMTRSYIEPRSRLDSAAMLAGEETAAEGAVGDDGRTVRRAKLALGFINLPHRQVVVILQDAKRSQAEPGLQREHHPELFRREITDSQRPDPASAEEIV